MSRKKHLFMTEPVWKICLIYLFRHISELDETGQTSASNIHTNNNAPVKDYTKHAGCWLGIRCDCCVQCCRCRSNHAGLSPLIGPPWNKLAPPPLCKRTHDSQCSNFDAYCCNSLNKGCDDYAKQFRAWGKLLFQTLFQTDLLTTLEDPQASIKNTLAWQR